MTSTRDSKIDAALSGLVLLAFLAIVIGNVLTFRGAAEMPGRWTILCGLVLGTIGATALSARVFWRHRIGLAGLMLMFGLHGAGMALATQLFNWLHPATHASNEKNAPGINALLLAVALMSTLLVRGAELQATVKNMPGWMAIRKENESATPRLWLFALYWISPLAWWTGIICVLNLTATGDAGVWWKITLILCIIIVITRISIRFVLLEKNKYSNWRRSPQGWEKFRALMVAAGFTLAGAVTFYAYFFMATRVQDDALEKWTRGAAEARLAELKSMQPPTLPAKENAETIYKLARASAIALNWEWAQKNWDTPAARNEVARNLTSLSYFRQASAIKGIDLDIDLNRPWHSSRWRMDDVYHGMLLELRQVAARGDWRTVNDNAQACFRYSLHRSALPRDSQEALGAEIQSARTLAAALLQADSHPSDSALVDLQKILTTHFDGRGEYFSRDCYFTFLSGYITFDHEQTILNDWPGKSDMQTMLHGSALFQWHWEMKKESILTTLKLMTNRRLDRGDMDPIAERVSHILLEDHPRERDFAKLFYGNINALETLRLLETAIGIRRYQVHFGTWPSTLDECVPLFLPAIPPDPNKRGRFVQYESAPPRVYTIGTGLTPLPQGHGYPDENYFQEFSLKIKECENGNHVLFLAN